MIGEPDERWVLASVAGYGFVVRLGELHGRNRAGKAVLKVPDGCDRARTGGTSGRRTDALLAAVNSDGRLLVFPVAELPELPRGKGNKIFGIPSKKAAAGEESLVAVAVVAPGQNAAPAVRRAPDEPFVQGARRLPRRAWAAWRGAAARLAQGRHDRGAVD